VSSEKTALLRERLREWPETLAVIEAVLAQWPEHDSYLLKSLQVRSPAIMAATEVAAGAVRKLMQGAEARFAADYRWTCDRLRDEELFFHREGRYRLSTFAEARAEVYSNAEYMDHYVSGLLLTQVLWYNHAATFEMFINRVVGAVAEPFRYLEVGPGHGLMVFFAAEAPLARSLEAWDVSEVSLRETRTALDCLAPAKPVSLVQTDILEARESGSKFDLIVISEVLEHLEDPAAALRFLRRTVSDEGRVFINVPLNSPSPDHIFLLSTPEEATGLAERAGFRVETLELFATQGASLERALATQISVSAAMIVVPA
jgi:2-polyprenyl-3-methyl-5-hydroxy-6-metoxy-1,4-benzoquinol methylase